MLLENCTKQTLDFVDLENGKPSFLASVGLRVKGGIGDLLFCEMVVDRNLDDVFRTAFDVNYDRRVRARGRCRLATGQDAYDTHRAKVRCVEVAGLEIAQLVWHTVAHVEKVGVQKDPAPLLNMCCADEDLFRLLSTPQIVTL